MTHEQFTADDGVRLADDYARAKRRVEAAEKELEEQKLRIIAYADQQNFTKLAGHGVNVIVTKQVFWKIPSMDEPRRQVLEGIIRDSGLWDRVSDLSKSKLTKTIGTKGFDPIFKDQISAFLKRDIMPIVRVSQKPSESIDDGPDPG